MTNSIDPEFAARVAAYEKNLKKGRAFAANGTVGGKRAKHDGPAWRSSFLRRALKFLILATLVKAMLFHAAHIVGYDATGAVLLDSSTLSQKVLALAFYPDPISEFATRWLTVGQQYLAIEVRKAM